MTDDEKPPDFSDVHGGSSSTAPTSGKSYNKSVIKDPDKIFPGQVISLPSKEELLS